MKQSPVLKRLFTSSTPFHPSRLHSKFRRYSSAAFTHARFFKLGLLLGNRTANHLINSYIKLHQISHAHHLFDEMPEPDVVSWTSLMSAYNRSGKPEITLSLYKKMSQTPVAPNEFTFSTLINGCSMLSNLEDGKKVHCHVEVFGFGDNIVVCSALVDMYGKCNDVEGARRVFDSMGFRNVVTWTSMITAYAQNGRGNEALGVFREFSSSVPERPNHYMLASVVSACSTLEKLILGKAAHGALIRGGHEFNNVVASALVDMYAKCGFFSYSENVFRRIQNPCVIPYTSMIIGATKCGLGQKSLDLFQEMVNKGIKPNSVTFLGVLHACSHAGLVDEGLKNLDSMSSKHGVIPEAVHYVCVVDMLSRIGRLDEAYNLAKSISVDPEGGALLWGTLLSASRLQGRVDIALEASEFMIKFNQQVAGAYVALSNAYALAGDWQSSQSLRSKMKHIGVSKEPGCSWVEIRDSAYVFYAGDLSCDRGEEILSLLKELEMRMREKGFEGGNELIGLCRC